MDALSDSTARVLDIEARQDDVLRQLEELERRLDQILAEYSPAPSSSAQPSAAPSSATLLADSAPSIAKAA